MNFKFLLPRIFKASFAGIFLLSSISFAAPQKTPGDFYEELSRLNKVLSEVDRKYVEAVDPAELSDAALEGIRNILDPHTAVFGPKDYESLRISMEGKFGGIGITISIRDKYLTVISPISGTPAYKLGIKAGDRIRKINGNDTHNMTLDEAVNQLRGKIGTDVNISIERFGTPELIPFKITRDEIIVHAVPYHGMLNKEVGYVKLATFSDKTYSETKAAIQDLQKQGMKKMILDLRYNPGGLLNQAVKVANIFLPKGSLIVSTNGRTQHTESRAPNNGILSKNIPVAVLVNQGSASASEIVSGALQDWDRALIIGKTTFGKGSVQTIFPLDNQNHALKMTTAFYYLPFGRCINRPENGIKGLELLESEATGEISADSIANDTASRDTFTTNNGRKMFGGGGIKPDIDIELPPMPWVIQLQERMAMYFKFVIKIRPTLEKQGVKIDSSWVVPDSIFEQFKAFCLKDTNFTKVKSNSLASLDALEKGILKEQEYMGDSSKTISDTLLDNRVKALKTALEKEKIGQFEKNKEYIQNGIKRELLIAVNGENAGTAFILKQDVQVKKAIEELSNKKLYKKILSGKKAKK